MKIYIKLLIIVGVIDSIEAKEVDRELSTCIEIKRLESTLDNSKKPDEILLRMGDIAKDIDIEIDTYRANPDYKNICHLKIVKSDNYGDFPTYSGYHYSQILKKYPKSNLIDDASYRLIYIITEDIYNFDDMNVEKNKLKRFIAKYPKSNKKQEAKARIKEIDRELKSGVPPILD